MIINLWSKKVHSFTCQLLVGNGDASYECKAESCLDYSAGGNSWGLQHSHEMFPLSVCLSLQGAWRSFQPLQLLLHKQPCNDFSYTEPQWWRILNWKKKGFLSVPPYPSTCFLLLCFKYSRGSFVMNFHQYLTVEFFPKITTVLGVIFKNFTLFLVIFKTNTSYNFISIRNIPACSCLQNFFPKGV